VKHDWLFKLMLAVLALFAVAIFAIPTKAQNVMLFQGVLCDEREQLLDFMDRLTKGEDGQKALDAVNARAGKELACGYAQTPVILEPPEAVTVNGKRAEVVSITIIPQGIQQWGGRFLDKLATFRDA